MGKVDPSDYVIDLGSGDGRVVISGCEDLPRAGLG